MASEPTVRHSVLDRLLRTDRRWDGNRPVGWRESLDVAKKSLLRDLQWLLNTRQISEPAGPPLEFLPRSMYNYGIPDIASLSADSSETAGHLLRFIEKAVEDFEPRLSDVRVTLAESGSKNDRRVEFLIEANLRVEPDPERVEFDTVLEVSSGKFALSSRKSPHD
jgi:type VI secretion system protein ImpF